MRVLGFLVPAFTSAAALSLSGCLLFASGPGADAGAIADAGDHSEFDAGDRGRDAGPIAVDAGPNDAGAKIDAGPGDAGPVVDAGPLDAGPPVCGNNALETGETCDDGNQVDDDYCTNDCEPNGVCGDGEVQPGIEVCDDGNQSDADYCSGGCMISGFCGDGVVQQDLEACEPSVAQINVECTDGCRVWWNTEFSVRIPVDVANNTNAELLNVPVAVSIPQSIQNEFGVSANNVCVIASDHQRRMRAHFETVNPPNLADSVLWVRIAALPPGTTRVFLYGNPPGGTALCPQLFTSVFAPAYSGVWHMESTSPQDRSDRSNDATPYGAPSVTDGILGSAVQTGNGSHVRVDDIGNSLGFLNDLSVEAWVRLDGVGGEEDRSAIFQLSPHLTQNPEVFLMNLMHKGAMRISWQPGGPNPNESARFDLVASEWHHYAWVRNSADKTVRFYRDGAQIGDALTYASNPSLTSANARFRMGGAHSDAWSLNGAIDEVRITDLVLSPEWIRFQVDMMSDDATVILGSPELVAAD